MPMVYKEMASEADVQRVYNENDENTWNASLDFKENKNYTGVEYCSKMYIYAELVKQKHEGLK